MGDSYFSSEFLVSRNPVTSRFLKPTSNLNNYRRIFLNRQLTMLRLHFGSHKPLHLMTELDVYKTQDTIIWW